MFTKLFIGTLAIILPISAIDTVRTELADMDQQVLQIVLTNLINHPKLQRPRNRTIDNPRIILTADTPDTEPPADDQVLSDIEVPLPREELDNMRQRASTQKPLLPFENFRFPLPIIVVRPPFDRSRISMEQRFPDAIAYFHPWLPGYSSDRKRVVVRGYLGPSAHGGAATALLQQDGQHWKLIWIKIVYWL